MASGLKTIAQDVGVSVSLVSKVLTGRMGNSTVRPETANAIRDRARQLRYVPNKSARALTSGSQHVIGVIVHCEGEAGSGLVNSLLRAIAAECEAKQQRLWLNFIETSAELQKVLSKTNRSSVDGVVIAGLRHTDTLPAILEVEALGVPVVTAHAIPLSDELPNVGVDQVEVQRIATAHLIAQGCRRIGHIRFHPPRFEGYRKALAEHGIAYDDSLVVDATAYHHGPGAEAVEKLLARHVPFDGLTAQSDQHALAAMNALLRRGRRVPQDVRVTGIDNSPICPLSLVPLTSVSEEFGPRGERALQMLLRRIRGEAVDSCWIDPVLHVRESSS